MALVRICLMAFTARYSDGNYNTAVLFVCVLVTLLIVFEVNSIIQRRMELTVTMIAQYSLSILVTQLHWISYSTHTPMSATLEYAYDPLLSEGITFSRESRYIGAIPSGHSRVSTLRRGTSYGTMSSSPFDTVQELDEEYEEDPDVFIKVNIDRTVTRTGVSQIRGSLEARQGFGVAERHENMTTDDDHTDSDQDQAQEDEDQDMATLLAFQDARRQQVFAFSPTASSAVMPTHSILSSPQALPNDSGNPNHRSPLSWDYQGRQMGGRNGSFASSYDMRMAAAGVSGAATLAGGQTVGYTARKRSLRSNTDLNGTARRTWTGGHNIIYSGIFVEDSDEDEAAQEYDDREEVKLSQDNEERHQERLGFEFDDTIKAEINESSVHDPPAIMEEQTTTVDAGQVEILVTTASENVDLSVQSTDCVAAYEQLQQPHLRFKDPSGDESQDGSAISAPQEAIMNDHILDTGQQQHHPHTLSTLKLHVSSHKDITAVMCDEDNCSEHQFQEGPAAELEAVLGDEYRHINVVHLDIKENSTSAVERTGDGINVEFEPSTECDSTFDTVIPNGVQPLNGTDDAHDIHIDNLSPVVAVNVETDRRNDAERTGTNMNDVIDLSDTAGIIVLETPPHDLSHVDPNAVLEEGRQKGEEDGHLRIRVHRRVENFVIDEEEDTVDTKSTRQRTSIGDGFVGGKLVGGTITIDDHTKIIPRTLSRPELLPQPTTPGQWTQTPDAIRPTGVITWGVVDDIDQEGPNVGPDPGPVVYTRPQRAVIVEPPPQSTSIAIGPPAPQAMVAIDPAPRQVLVSPPRLQQMPAPIKLQPQPQPYTERQAILRPPPPQMVYAPQPRPMIAYPQQELPPPPPILQPNPVMTRALPEPFLQPTAPVLMAPQPQIEAPRAPVLQPQYGTYETIVPARTQGINMSATPGAAVEGDVGERQLNRGHSIASVYGEDAQSIVSIYDDRSLASVHELEGYIVSGAPMAIGAEIVVGGAGLGTAVEHRRPWMRSAQPLPGIAYSHGSHLGSAAQATRRSIADVEARHLVRTEEVRDVGTEHTSDIHSQAVRLSDASLCSGYDDGSEGSGCINRTDAIANGYHNLDLGALEHSAPKPDPTHTDTLYCEMELQSDLTTVTPLQELAIETYYDTTKSQLRVREKQGQVLSEMVKQLKRRRQQVQEGEKGGQEQQSAQYNGQAQSNEEQQRLPPSAVSSGASTSAAAAVPSSSVPPTSSQLRSPQQHQMQQSPPTLNFPKPPQSPPPVRLLVNRSPVSSSLQSHAVRIEPRSPSRRYGVAHAEPELENTPCEDGSSTETPILSRSAQHTENIMLRIRYPSAHPDQGALVVEDEVSRSSVEARTLISEPVLTPNIFHTVDSSRDTFKVQAANKPPLPDDLTVKVGVRRSVYRKARQNHSVLPMSRRHLHPSLLQDGIMACWNNEFGTALEMFKDHSTTYPRWSLAAAEVHIVRQLISGQLSEADSELIDALQLSEKVASRILDRRQEFGANFIAYQSICSADASLASANDRTLRQNYKWDCEMAFYDTLLYRSILQLTSISDTKGTFSDIKGGLQLRRAWKGYMRIKQEMELAKEKWQRLSALASSKARDQDQENLLPTAPVTSIHHLGESPDQLQDGSSFRLLSSAPSAAKGVASILRDQTKAAEEIKTAVQVLEDIEDYLHYGIGLFYFIVSVVPKSLLPALKTIGLQTNHELGIKTLEQVFARKNGRAPFAALFLLINYLFLPRGMSDPNISLERAGELICECLKNCPNGSSYLLMACHHARKTGHMIPAALNHITRGIQTCEAAGIPSINYRFELGLTFFIHQEFGKAADIFEILWLDLGLGGIRNAALDIQQEEDEEDEFELAPFCGLCLIASKAVIRQGQEGYFGYGRDGFGHHTSGNGGALSSPSSGLLFDTAGSGSTTPLNIPRPGPDFDLLVSAQEVLLVMSGDQQQQQQQQGTMSSVNSAASEDASSKPEHPKMGSSQSTASLFVNSSPTRTQAGKLNRFNKFAWNQCQKSLQRGRISPFLPLVILYLRRDLAYMKPVLLRKYRALLESIWKTVQYSADADTQAIYLLLSAVVHRQLLPDDSTFAYTALTDCLLLESFIENELWIVPHCHYELGELLFKRLHLAQAALEQFQWIVKGPCKETRSTTIHYTASTSISNPRLSVFGGGYPSEAITSMVENAAAQASAHSNQPSAASSHRLSQLFPPSTGGGGVILGSSPTCLPAMTVNPPNPMTFYNSRYKKFEFSQALRQRSSVCIEQIQKEIDAGGGGGGGTGRLAGWQASVSTPTTIEQNQLESKDEAANASFPAGPTLK
ncbi:hypothetical protein EDD11_006420 [Mortierella claussenii]|nr:hypothetical protein EDD11_006420 [Mortierella claussenii]